jgi:hypothetical protein
MVSTSDLGQASGHPFDPPRLTPAMGPRQLAVEEPLGSPSCEQSGGGVGRKFDASLLTQPDEPFPLVDVPVQEGVASVKESSFAHLPHDNELLGVQSEMVPAKRVG